MIETLVKENEKLIYYIINHHIVKKTNYNYEIEDLFQVGVIGLLKAKDNYKDSSNTKFSSYAYTWILGEIIKYVRENNHLKISPDIIKLNKSIHRAKELLTQKLGKVPSTSELSSYLEIPESKIIEAINANQDVKSLDFYFDEDFSLYDSIKVEEKSLKDELIDLRDALNKLSIEEKRLIIDRYFNDLTQSETSKNLNMSQVQVSRAEQKILLKLKDKLVA
jgi:RNA polymerase sporulation-specific sigma factor